jgi:hypothetical protein
MRANDRRLPIADFRGSFAPSQGATASRNHEVFVAVKGPTILSLWLQPAPGLPLSSRRLRDFPGALGGSGQDP